MSSWRCVILAAGRGPDDPMAKAYGVAHKCTLPIAGKPMLAWVLDALRQSRCKSPFVLSIDSAEAGYSASAQADDILIRQSANSAPSSALEAITALGHYPVLITTGDHPLLTPAMINAMLAGAEQSGADVSVGLATSEVINAAYPQTRRTYFNLGGTRVSGCNLFAITSPPGLKLLERWQDLEKKRKKPWKLVAAFGLMPIVWFAIGKLTPERAFGMMSEKLGITVRPVFLPYAEAAIDVDKPSDHALAESILQARLGPA